MSGSEKSGAKCTRLHGLWRDALWLLVSAVLLLCGLLLPLRSAFALSGSEEAVLRAIESGELVRMHVVAHSDSAYDQLVKLAVRDAVMDTFGDTLFHAADCGSSDELCAALQTQLPAIEAVALQRAKKMGFQGGVKAEAGLLSLPEKRFGTITLPAGTYRSLRITLGSGQGRNWWCVLYPRLCATLAQEPGTDSQPQLFHWSLPLIFDKWLLLGRADML